MPEGAEERSSLKLQAYRLACYDLREEVKYTWEDDTRTMNVAISFFRGALYPSAIYTSPVGAA
jgi:hypothetical protein